MIQWNLWNILLLFGLFLEFLVGCGTSGLPDMVQVRGKVLYNNKPLPGGTIVYLPASGPGGRQAQGVIGPDGRFELSSLKPGDGVQKGGYDIIILAHEQAVGPPRSRVELETTGGFKQQRMIIPEKYADPDTSGLSDIVDDNHPGYIEIELGDLNRVPDSTNRVERRFHTH
ncbi:MAG: hypothetical protein JW829_01355 [Pirellulales bacterium]|nr:hypothetical protein [Pirellulales bacterium]